MCVCVATPSEVLFWSKDTVLSMKRGQLISSTHMCMCVYTRELPHARRAHAHIHTQTLKVTDVKPEKNLEVEQA